MVLIEMYVSCLQGPMEDTISDFWMCVSEHKVSTIVMLTSLVEKGRVKCAQYWPQSSSQPLVLASSKTMVSLVSTSQQDNLTIRQISLLNTDTEQEKIVTQIQVQDWSDHSVPHSTAVLLNLIQVLQSLTSAPTSLFSLVK